MNELIPVALSSGLSINTAVKENKLLRGIMLVVYSVFTVSRCVRTYSTTLPPPQKKKKALFVK